MKQSPNLCWPCPNKVNYKLLSNKSMSLNKQSKPMTRQSLVKATHNPAAWPLLLSMSFFKLLEQCSGSYYCRRQQCYSTQGRNRGHSKCFSQRTHGYHSRRNCHGCQVEWYCL